MMHADRVHNSTAHTAEPWTWPVWYLHERVLLGHKHELEPFVIKSVHLEITVLNEIHQGQNKR